MLETNRMTKFMFRRVDNSLPGVAVAGVEKVPGVELDISMNQVAGGGVGFGIGQTGGPVLLLDDGSNYNIGIRFVLYLPKGEGPGLVPLPNCFFGRGPQGRIAEGNVNGAAVFWPAPIGNVTSFFRLAGSLLRSGLIVSKAVKLPLCEQLCTQNGRVHLLLESWTALVKSNQPDK